MLSTKMEPLPNSEAMKFSDRRSIGGAGVNNQVVSVFVTSEALWRDRYFRLSTGRDTLWVSRVTNIFES
ncbi:MAG: hypothetical protein VYB72_14155 [Planctomycetota bacterium]|nr:hypothetical protein [Planctomycetota bacterium]